MNDEQKANSGSAFDQIGRRIQRARSLKPKETEFILLLLSTVFTMFFFDSIFDFLGGTSFPFLFSTFLHPVNIAGFVEYLVGFCLLSVSLKKRISGLSYGLVICFLFSVIFLLQKLGVMYV